MKLRSSVSMRDIKSVAISHELNWYGYVGRLEMQLADRVRGRKTNVSLGDEDNTQRK